MNMLTFWCVCVGVCAVLCRGVIAPTHPVWKTLNGFAWGERKDVSSPSPSADIMMMDGGETCGRAVDDVMAAVDCSGAIPILTHPLRLMDVGGNPLFTNFTLDYRDTLDHILVEAEAMRLVRCLPNYESAEQLQQHAQAEAIPSQCMPSDHIAVVVDVALLCAHAHADADDSAAVQS